MFHNSLQFVHDQQEDSTNPDLNVTDSPKKRRGANKKVVSLLIGGGDDPRSKAEIHPPQDSWSWRKYGQKPIKGSPYPRGYYRCSSSKGCPAKKQVERSYNDPNILLVTYSCEHNHSQSTTTKLDRNYHLAAACTTIPVSPISVTSNSTSTSSNASDVPSTLAQEEIMPPDSNNLSELTEELGWFSYIGSSTLLNSPALESPAWADVDVTVMLPIGEEDQSLFGELGELPEGSVVFRQGIMEET